MAIDTAAKRASAVGTGTTLFGIHLPSSGGIDAEGERQAVAYSYAGITSGAADGGGSGSPITDRRRRAIVGVPFGLPFGGVEVTWPSLL